jgi:ferredoxin
MSGKSILSIAAMAIFILAGCKKTHTCVCVVTDGSQTPAKQDTYTYTYEKSKKKDAEVACDQKAAFYTSTHTGPNDRVDCQVK